MTDPLTRLLSRTRDSAIIVLGNPPIADALWRCGAHVVHVGERVKGIPSAANASELQKDWSKLTRRVPNVAVYGNDSEVQAVAQQMTNQAQLNRSTTLHRAQGWVKAVVSNLHYLQRPTAMQLSGFRGVPAFIVGCGSSLDENYEQIDEARTKGLVIAINGANRAVDAHMALTIESNDLRFKLGDISDQAMRAFSITAHPEVMKHGNGPLFPIYSGEVALMLEPITKVPRVLSSATGGAAALSLAERLGCDPIVLVGQDFEMRDGGRIYPECVRIGDSTTHRDGNTWRMQWADVLKKQPRHNPLNPTDTVQEWKAPDGSPVLTSTMLGNQMFWFSQVGRRLSHERLMINASERGCYIDGWKHGKLADVLSELPQRQLKAVAPEVGVTRSRLAEVFDGWLQACDAAQSETSEGYRGAGSSAALRSALQRCPLIELWCFPYVQAVMDERRQEPVSMRYLDEFRAARGVMHRLYEAVGYGVGELTEMLQEGADGL